MATGDEIKIEKGIPVPERGVSVANKYPWRDMQIGDSFLVPREGEEPIGLARDRAHKAVQYAKKKTNMKFCTRTSEAGTRVWRIE